MAKPNSGAPRRFGLGGGKNVDLSGFSDHFPVGVRLMGGGKPPGKPSQ